jgi:hypothetical protein
MVPTPSAARLVTSFGTCGAPGDGLLMKGAGHMASAHFESLSAKHRQLESVIFEELQRPVPDTIHLAQLKKEKLRLKEEMERERRH